MSVNKANGSIDWNQLINDYKNSGLGLNNWCKNNSIKASTMRYHVYEAPKHKSRSSSNSKIIKLVPVEKEIEKSSCIELLVGGSTIKVDGSTDMKLLSNLMRSLQND